MLQWQSVPFLLKLLHFIINIFKCAERFKELYSNHQVSTTYILPLAFCCICFIIYLSLYPLFHPSINQSLLIFLGVFKRKL